MRSEPEREGQDPFAEAAMDWHFALSEAPERATAPRDHEALLARFEAWLSQDRRHLHAWNDLTALLSHPALRAASVADAARLPPLMHPAAGERRRGFWSRPLLSGLAVAAGLTALWIWAPGLWLRWQADALTGAGELLVVTLPDGSRADLNSNSALAFDFSAGRRQVTLLQGEAWFDVIHDADHPFIVDAGETEVTVKGTAFAVRATGEENLVMLERGSVRVAQGGYEVILSPGEMVGMGEGAAPVPVRVEPSRALAWREGWVLISDQSFPSALAELSRHYPGRVLDLSSAGDRVVSGSFRTDDAEAAIRSVAAASGVSVSRMPGGMLILR